MKNIIIYLVLGTILGYCISMINTNTLGNEDVLKLVQQKCRVVNFGQFGRINCFIKHNNK